MKEVAVISDLKHRVARGAVNNLVFAAAGNGLLFLQSIIVMRLVGPEQTGLFAMALAIGLTLESISDFGINDRLVQAPEATVRDSYALALAAQIVLGFATWVLLYLAAPSVARLYGHAELQPLVQVIGYMALGGAARLPAALLYRELRFFEQRATVFAGRVVGFVVTIAAAFSGAGVWSLIYGGVCTLFVTGAASWALAPYLPRFRFRLSELRPLLMFSVPVWLSKLTYVFVQQGAVLVLSLFLSVGDVGQFKFAEQLASLVFYVEVVLGQTIFPALCRLSPADMGRAFVTCSRVSMMWIGATSVGLCVFAHDIVRLALTSEWAGAELFLVAQGVALMFGATISNWDVIFKARNNTVPMFQMSVVFLAAFAAAFVPLVVSFGRLGTAAGLVLVAVVTFLGRAYFVKQQITVSLIRTIAPALAAALVAAAATMTVGLVLADMSPVVRFALRVLTFAVTYALVLYRTDATLVRVVRSAVHRPDAVEMPAPSPVAGSGL